MKPKRVLTIMLSLLMVLSLALSGCGETKSDTYSGFGGAVIYSPHQDDETLFFSQAVTEAIDEFGVDNVWVVLFSDGAESKVQQDNENVSNALMEVVNGIDEILTEKGAAALSDEQKLKLKQMLFSKARTNEFIAAVEALGVKPENITVYDFHDSELQDHIEEMKDIMKSYIDNAGDKKLMHYTLSPVYEFHNDHKATAEAMTELYQEGVITEKEAVNYIVRRDLALYNEDLAEEAFGEKNSDEFTVRYITYQGGNDVTKAAAKEYEFYDYNMDGFAEAIVEEYLENGGSVDNVSVDGIIDAYDADELSNLRLGIGIISVGPSFELLNEQIDSGEYSTLIHNPS